MFTFAQLLTPKTVQRISSNGARTKKCPPPKVPDHKEGGYKIYKFMSLFVAIPITLAVASYTFMQKMSRGCEERPPFVPYETMRRRTKRFPWGDGNKSLFHNPEVNALPEGYEEGSGCVPVEHGDESKSDCED